MRMLIGVVALAAVVTAASAADRRIELPAARTIAQFTPIPVPVLPPRNRNHCGVYNGRIVCADHCGIGYQVYYCPATATGCCHTGLGYCDAAGRLRCTLPWF